jgi:hypothetical protein
LCLVCLLCPKCQAPLPANAPEGLCSRCLLAAVATPTEAGQPAKASAVPPSLETVAAAFPQLEILELIGSGGMGAVYKARQPRLDRCVALKLLPHSLAADPAFAERFSRETRLLGRLNHPNIVTVHNFGIAKLIGDRTRDVTLTVSGTGQVAEELRYLVEVLAQPEAR